MKIEVHLLSHDDEPMLPWALRHYGRFATKIIVHDGGPLGKSSIFAHFFGAESKPWDTAGQLNDDLAAQLKNSCWRGTDADWVIVGDADELIYFPEGAVKTLNKYEGLGAAVIKPYGFEMFSDTFWPESFVKEVPIGQIYDHVRDGASDDEWYSKPILFTPSKVAESGFGVGAHEARMVMHNGYAIHVGRNFPKANNPQTWLLHFHQLGPIERVAKRYDETRLRLSSVNVRKKWGNFRPGIEHAKEKRDRILPSLRRVIA